VNLASATQRIAMMPPAADIESARVMLYAPATGKEAPAMMAIATIQAKTGIIVATTETSDETIVGTIAATVMMFAGITGKISAIPPVNTAPATARIGISTQTDRVRLV
jgi:hypothetical protein